MLRLKALRLLASAVVFFSAGVASAETVRLTETVPAFHIEKKDIGDISFTKVISGFDGNFLVSWHGNSDSSGTIFGRDIFAAIYDATGKVVAGPKIVRPRYTGLTGDNSSKSTFVKTKDGNYAFIWSKIYLNPSNVGTDTVYYRLFDKNLNIIKNTTFIGRIMNSGGIGNIDCNSRLNCWLSYANSPNQSAIKYIKKSI